MSTILKFCGATRTVTGSYIPMARGFVYLAVVLDWFSRRVLWL